MIRHIALAKYKGFAEGFSKAENMKKAYEMTESLVERIPYIKMFN